jgi:predicted nucleic acid-binding protein
MNLVDSSGWIEHFTAGSLADSFAPYLRQPKEVLSSPIVVFEVYRKIRRSRSESEALLAASQIRKVRVEPVTEAVALEAAELSLSHGLAMADALVYATARLFHAVLVTSDADFADLPGVEYLPKI